MHWDRAKIASFLDRLKEAANYKSERQMARDLGELQETVNGWRNAKKGPSRLEAFLRRYAEKHGYNEKTLVERWELVRVDHARDERSKMDGQTEVVQQAVLTASTVITAILSNAAPDKIEALLSALMKQTRSIIKNRKK